MAQQIINYGAAANDGTGDPLRDAFIKTDDNFDQIWAAGPVGSNVTILNNSISVTNTNGNIILNPNGIGIIQTNRHLYPRLDNTYTLGRANLRYRGLYIGADGITNDGNLTMGNIANLHILGGENGYVVQTDGTGNLSWVAQGGAGNGNPGGANTQIQFNDSNFFGGAVGFTFDKTSNLLSVPGNVTASFYIGDGSQLANIPVRGVIQANVPPADPTSNTLWWDEVTGRLYVWYTDQDGSQWVDAAPAQGGYGNTTVSSYLASGTNTEGIDTSGNVSASYFIGDGQYISNISVAGGTKIENGNSYANVETVDGNVVIGANGPTWTFNTTGSIDIPAESNSFDDGRIQSANGYPTLLGYGSGSHGGPELDWMDSDDPANAFGNSSVLRNTMYINDGGLFVGMNENEVANVAVVSWRFTTDGTTIFPTLDTQRGDNPSGTITGQTLLFGDATQEAIISTPDGIDTFPNSQRLVINPGQGYGPYEGGDIYLWAGRGGNASGSGGDIKIRGGQGGANTVGGSGGAGGYIRMEAGDADGDGQAGYVEITGGYGNAQGGNVSISGGYGTALGGNVLINSGGYTWTVGTYGKITLPFGASLNDTSGDSVAFGQNAGNTSQERNAVAIGSQAGREYQGEDSIAIGKNAGYYNQGRGVAIGYHAGQGTQDYTTVSDANGGSGPAHTYVSGDGTPSLVLDSVTDVVTYNQYVTGNNIPAYTYVTNIYPGEDRIDISQAPIAALSPGDAITFIGSNIGVASTSGLVAGARVLGTNIPNNTYINSIIGPNNIDISQRPSAPLVDAAALNFYIGQGDYATAVGYDAGTQYQDARAVAIGYAAGTNHQGPNTVAVGYLAGAYTQSTNAVAVGYSAGAQTQGINTVAVGYHAGGNVQGAGAVAIGEDAGYDTQGEKAVAIGLQAGNTTQANAATAVGSYAGNDSQGLGATAIGYNAGRFSQGISAVAVGERAGDNGQGNSAVAVGYGAGYGSQGQASVAMGFNAGSNLQGNSSVALGEEAGYTGQGQNSIAIGRSAGQSNQGNSAIAMGWAAAQTTQGNAAVAIGEDAGRYYQGEYSIAIGYQAGYNTQGNNSIVLNASGDQINGTTANSFTVKPIRSATTGNVLYYDQQSGEITFDVGGGAANTGNVTFSDQIVIGTGISNLISGLYLSPSSSSANAVQYLRVRGDVTYEPTHIHFDTGNNQYFNQFIGDDNKYVLLSNIGDIVIRTDDYAGNSAQWTFGADGNLTIPGNILGSGNILIAPDSASSSSYLDIYLTGGPDIHIASNDNSIVIGRDTGANVFVGNDGEVSIQASNGTPHTWTFDTNSNLSAPGNISATGNVTGGNLVTAGSGGDITLTGGNITGAGNISATGNVTAANFFGNVSASGNIIGGNISATGNITANYFIGNLATPTYGSFYDTTTQINSNVGNAIPISYNATDINNGVTITGAGNTQITIAETGIYNIQFSLQVRKTDSGADTVYVWLDKNGNRVSNSATALFLTGSGAAEVAAWNFVVSAAANDYYRLMWMSTDSHVEIVAVTAGAVVPAIPSVILTVVPVGA